MVLNFINSLLGGAWTYIWGLGLVARVAGLDLVVHFINRLLVGALTCSWGLALAAGGADLWLGLGVVARVAGSEFQKEISCWGLRL